MRTDTDRKDLMVDTAGLRAAYDAFLEAADSVADADAGASAAAPPGSWNAEQVLGHVALINAMTISAAHGVAAGDVPRYDNRHALDVWTIERTIRRAGGSAGLRDRIRDQADALTALDGPVLSDADLDTPLPTLLLSNDALLVDQPMPLRDLLAGLAETEIPGHTRQLLSTGDSAALQGSRRGRPRGGKMRSSERSPSSGGRRGSGTSAQGRP